MNKLLSIQEASELLSLKVPTLYKYICTKKVPYVKIGGRVLFEVESLDEWVKEHIVLPATVD